MPDLLLKADAPSKEAPSAAIPPAVFPGGTRVFDKVVVAFNLACAVGDMEAAEDLLALLQKISERRVRRFGGSRRKESETLAHARAHLAWVLATPPG